MTTRLVTVIVEEVIDGKMTKMEFDRLIGGESEEEFAEMEQKIIDEYSIGPQILSVTVKEKED